MFIIRYVQDPAQENEGTCKTLPRKLHRVRAKSCPGKYIGCVQDPAPGNEYTCKALLRRLHASPTCCTAADSGVPPASPHSSAKSRQDAAAAPSAAAGRGDSAASRRQAYNAESDDFETGESEPVCHLDSLADRKAVVGSAAAGTFEHSPSGSPCCSEPSSGHELSGSQAGSVADNDQGVGGWHSCSHDAAGRGGPPLDASGCSRVHSAPREVVYLQHQNSSLTAEFPMLLPDVEAHLPWATGESPPPGAPHTVRSLTTHPHNAEVRVIPCTGAPY